MAHTRANHIWLERSHRGERDPDFQSYLKAMADFGAMFVSESTWILFSRTNTRIESAFISREPPVSENPKNLRLSDFRLDWVGGNTNKGEAISKEKDLFGKKEWSVLIQKNNLGRCSLLKDKSPRWRLQGRDSDVNIFSVFRGPKTEGALCFCLMPADWFALFKPGFCEQNGDEWTRKTVWLSTLCCPKTAGSSSCWNWT